MGHRQKDEPGTAAAPEFALALPRKAGADPQIEVAVLEEEDVRGRLAEPWRVILFNDDDHSFDEVIFQVVKATGCATNEAERLVWRAHLTGRSRVFEGVMDRCLDVQSVLREIALIAEIHG